MEPRDIYCSFIHKNVIKPTAVCAPVVLQEEYNYEDVVYEDSEPLNCSTTESIRGGHVTYSQVNKETNQQKNAVRVLTDTKFN